MTPTAIAATAVLMSRPGYKPNLIDSKFQKQADFLKDQSRLKALFCTRRAAKSYTGGLGLYDAAINTDECNTLYLGLTRLSAKGIVWKDVLKAIDKKKMLGCKFNETELTVTTKNNSMIYVTGIDADENEMEKLLGKKYKRIVVDEAASYSVDLRRLIYGILKPTTVDMQGDIWMMGTSGDLTQGLFYDITTGKEAGWRLFEWTAFDNPYVAKQWQEELDDIKINRPLFMQTPLFKQWYLNQWVIDTEKLVYRFDQSKNSYGILPFYKSQEWQYVLGVDLGYSPDPSAFALCAFHENDPNLYVVETFKRTEMDITDVANKIKWYQGNYNIFRVIIDGSNKQAVEEMQRRHDIALTAADKAGKVDFIQLMNAEFIQGKIKLSTKCADLVDEYFKLIWKLDGDKIALPRKENENCQNHLTDAALYAWRFTYTYLSQAAKPVIDPRNKDQWMQHTEKLMDESLERQINHQQAEEAGNDIWNTSGMDNETEVLSYYLNKKRNT